MAGGCFLVEWTEELKNGNNLLFFRVASEKLHCGRRSQITCDLLRALRATYKYP
jgi:hypothetical protein